MNQFRMRETILFGAVLTLLLLYAPPANGQRQNQLCRWDDSQKQGCWQCGSGAGFGCRVESCTSCTNTTCGGLMVGWMVPGFSYVAQCLLPVEQSQRIADEGTVGIAAQEGAPAVLVVATHDTADLFAGGKLMNTGNNTIRSYKLGWVVLQPQSKPSFYAGEWMAVPTGIRSGATQEIPGQGVPFKLLYQRQMPTRIKFFVSELKFANGTTWKANLKSIITQEKGLRSIEPKMRSS